MAPGIGSPSDFVTVVTVAHSLTLGLAVLDVLMVPDRLVEAVIAASIAYVALENAGGARRAIPALAGELRVRTRPRARVRVGPGSLDLPGADLAMAPLTVNVGVELGQAAVILVAVPLLVQLRRRAWEGRLVRVASVALVAVGVVVRVQRLLA